jgi:hypothetical protein
LPAASRLFCRRSSIGVWIGLGQLLNDRGDFGKLFSHCSESKYNRCLGPDIVITVLLDGLIQLSIDRWIGDCLIVGFREGITFDMVNNDLLNLINAALHRFSRR